ncbi:hypothetical protein [Thiomonas sp.]|jgi:hypothetical protein|uniref:hypothetical protein n=1 Tax=Thiomonas sp. TaxID=2047785 RepID=UPI0025833311|nr:hypothetical protein [Thiomonas sp.]
MAFLLVFLAIIVLGAIASAGRRDIYAEGRRLYRAFRALGNMKGKPFTEIQEAVGNPTSISNMAAGTRLRQWQATGFHIAILFDKLDHVDRVTHQFTKLPE